MKEEKVYMVWMRNNMEGENDFIQMKVVFSEKEGLDSIPKLIEGKLKRLKRDVNAFNLAKENKIKVYKRGECEIVDLFTVEEIDPFYIESHLFPVEIWKQMMQHGLNLLKKYKGPHPSERWF